MDKILIVQDSPAIGALLKRIFEVHGFFVETVETGEDGIKKAKEEPFQLILLDCGLPGISGIEVCSALKKEKNTRDIPIVFMSASSEGEISKIAKDTGADGYIGVPFEEKELVEKIKGFIESHKGISGKG